MLLLEELSRFIVDRHAVVLTPVGVFAANTPLWRRCCSHRDRAVMARTSGRTAVLV
jgi:hypothetical protein